MSRSRPTHYPAPQHSSNDYERAEQMASREVDTNRMYAGYNLLTKETIKQRLTHEYHTKISKQRQARLLQQKTLASAAAASSVSASSTASKAAVASASIAAISSASASSSAPTAAMVSTLAATASSASSISSAAASSATTPQRASFAQPTQGEVDFYNEYIGAIEKLEKKPTLELLTAVDPTLLSDDQYRGLAKVESYRLNVDRSMNEMKIVIYRKVDEARCKLAASTAVSTASRIVGNVTPEGTAAVSSDAASHSEGDSKHVRANNSAVTSTMTAIADNVAPAVRITASDFDRVSDENKHEDRVLQAIRPISYNVSQEITRGLRLSYCQFWNGNQNDESATTSATSILESDEQNSSELGGRISPFPPH